MHDIVKTMCFSSGPATAEQYEQHVYRCMKVENGMLITGASDCATCVGIQLEMVRAMLADPALELPAPIVFAFNVGEETLSQAAHGYMAQSKFAAELGAFIIIKSTGSGEPDILFQCTGGASAL